MEKSNCKDILKMECEGWGEGGAKDDSQVGTLDSCVMMLTLSDEEEEGLRPWGGLKSLLGAEGKRIPVGPWMFGSGT